MKNASSVIFLSVFLVLVLLLLLLVPVVAIISTSSAADQQRPQRLRTSRHVLQSLGFSYSETCHVCREGFELETPDLVVALGSNNDMACGIAMNAGMLGWIPSNQCNQFRRTCICIDPTRKSWPELVGMDAEQAKQIIEEDEPDLDVFILSPDSYVGMEYKATRVWIRTNVDGTVKDTPMIG
jgi:hypothetical protein